MERRHRKGPIELKVKVPEGHPFFGLIQEAYSAFSGYNPVNVDVCTECCIAKEVEAEFFRPRIEELPFHFLREWFSAACATEGVRKDIWAYLLPRVLEVLAIGEEPKDVGIEVTLARFDTGNPNHWSNEQWSVLDRFQRQFLRSGFQSQSVWPDQFLDDIICMFRCGGWPLDDLLSQVEAMPDEQLARRLWKDWCTAFGDYGQIWLTAFWEKADKARMKEFYTCDSLKRRMEALVLSDTANTEDAVKASAVFSVIERAA